MKFTAKEDVAVPIAPLFEMLTDFGRTERQALRRGIGVVRRDTRKTPDLGTIGPGMAWAVDFRFRNKPRTANLTLTDLENSEGMGFDIVSGGLESRAQIELVALSAKRTRLAINIGLAPRNLPARLLVQSLRLGRARLVRRFRHRVAAYARELEERYATLV